MMSTLQDSINQTDKVIVKSVGVCEHTHKSGKVVKYSSTQVICTSLTSNNALQSTIKTSFCSITVPARTLHFLPEVGQAILKAKGLIIEK